MPMGCTPRYTLTPEEHKVLNGRLDLAIRVGDDERIIAECDRAEAIFSERGYPDDWSRWERARMDVLMKQAHCKPW